MVVNMLDRFDKGGRSYGPSTVYIHEKKVPYPYYIQEPHHQHRCEIFTNDNNRQHVMTPHYILPLVVLGVIMLFAILTLGLLLLVDRARLTPVVRARLLDLQNPSSHIATVEEILMKAVEAYHQLNTQVTEENQHF